MRRGGRQRSEGEDAPTEEVLRRLAFYVVVVTAALTLVGVASAFALGFYWSASLSPVMDGQKVLELQSAQEVPAREGPDAH